MSEKSEIEKKGEDVKKSEKKHRGIPGIICGFSLLCCFCLMMLLLLATPAALASEPVYGPGNSIMAVICVEANNTYKGFVPHYNDHFPPGSTVKIYVEAEGKTKKDMKTGEYKPSITFKMTGTRPTGGTFTASTSSSKLINHDSTLYKETYGVISFSVGKDVATGDYRFRVEARDRNKGNELIGRTPYMHFYVYEDATLYPPINYVYTNLTIDPDPVEVGKTVKVTVNVTNLGGKGNWKGETVYLNVDGMEIAARKKLKLDHNENTTAEFSLTKRELGEVPATFNVSIGGLNKTLVLKEKTSSAGATRTTPTPTPECGAKIPGFSLFSALAAFSVIVLVRRHRFPPGGKEDDDDGGKGKKMKKRRAC
jgi:hypothetical protein